MKPIPNRYAAGNCLEILTVGYSREQGLDRTARRPDATHSPDAVAQRRSAMQCGWMHHKPRYARGEQGQDCTIGRTGTLDKTCKVKGYAGTAKCHGRSPEHDALWSVLLFSL